MAVTFPQLLTLAFIVLKLTGVVTWSWWWILAPLWISVALTVALTVALAEPARAQGRRSCR